MSLTETQKLVAKGLGIIAASIVAYVIIYQVFIQPGKMREAVTVAEGQQTVADGRQETSEAARKETERYYVEKRIIEERVDSGVRDVLQAPDDAGASDAARRAACMFNHSYPPEHPTCKVQ